MVLSTSVGEDGNGTLVARTVCGFAFCAVCMLLALDGFTMSRRAYVQ